MPHVNQSELLAISVITFVDCGVGSFCVGFHEGFNYFDSLSLLKGRSLISCTNNTPHRGFAVHARGRRALNLEKFHTV